MKWTPYELPFAVEEFHAATIAEQDNVKSFLSVFQDPTPQSEIDKLNERDLTLLKATNNPEMTWIDKDVCSLISESAQNIPEWSPQAAMPSENGLVAFDKQVMTWNLPHDHRDPTLQSKNVNIDILMWSSLPDERVLIMGLSRCNNKKDLSPTYMMADLMENLNIKVPVEFHPTFAKVGNTSLTIATSMTIDEHQRQSASHLGLFTLDRRTGLEDPQTIEDLEEMQQTDHIPKGFGKEHELISVLGATWLLMGQPNIVENDTSSVNVMVRKKSQKKGTQRPKQKVRVSVRHLTTTARNNSRKGSGNKATTRWWVRGHWRQQACGPNRSLRKPIYIEPHTAGAADAPVDDRPSVQIIKD